MNANQVFAAAKEIIIASHQAGGHKWAVVDDANSLFNAITLMAIDRGLDELIDDGKMSKKEYHSLIEEFFEIAGCKFICRKPIDFYLMKSEKLAVIKLVVAAI